MSSNFGCPPFRVHARGLPAPEEFPLEPLCVLQKHPGICANEAEKQQGVRFPKALRGFWGNWNCQNIPNIPWDWQNQDKPPAPPDPRGARQGPAEGSKELFKASIRALRVSEVRLVPLPGISRRVPPGFVPFEPCIFGAAWLDCVRLCGGFCESPRAPPAPSPPPDLPKPPPKPRLGRGARGRLWALYPRDGGFGHPVKCSHCLTLVQTPVKPFGKFPLRPAHRL